MGSKKYVRFEGLIQKLVYWPNHNVLNAWRGPPYNNGTMGAGALAGVPSLPVGLLRPSTTEGEPYDRPVPTKWKLVLELRLKNLNESWKTIAKLAGYSYQTVLMWSKDPEFQRYETWLIERRLIDTATPEQRAQQKATMERVRDKFESHAEEMQERLLTILETAEEPGLQAKIAQDWLDRSGAPAQRVDSGRRGFAVVMTEEMLASFFARSREAGLTIEAEPIAQQSLIDTPTKSESDNGGTP